MAAGAAVMPFVEATSRAIELVMILGSGHSHAAGVHDR